LPESHADRPSAARKNHSKKSELLTQLKPAIQPFLLLKMALKA
jgi:hypothetical protein